MPSTERSLVACIGWKIKREVTMNEREELFAEKLHSQGWLSNEQAHELRAKLQRAERDLAIAFASIKRFREWRASIVAVVNSKDSNER